ncbi:MAG: YibE/F family protein [Candidatus Pacebacteria bacterium]|nr:YibE/F family protein [Candidatus Paceibacterota bacterium]MDD5357461.1 YibE/F family protein [Candidatus Paceibacterota bacterium]
MKYFSSFILLTLVFLGGIQAAKAADLVPESRTTAKAQVLEILSQERKDIPGTDTLSDYQTLKVKILDGDEKGAEVTVENDYLNLQKGDVFYLIHTIDKYNNINVYSVSEPYRIPALYFFIGLFVVCVVLFGGKQGVRGIIALALSFFFIGFLLLPGILHGYSPVLVSIGVSSLIIILGSYITHGFNKTTSSAVIGMIVTIIVTGILAFFAIKYARLSGFTTDESVYLNQNSRGQIDLAGLLLGGILIGLLGVLYDAAIGQAIAVEELHEVGPHLPKSTIYRRAIRIGREHIGALVNTLAIAYVGASLPLLLLFYSFGTGDYTQTINKEIFSTEIIRAIIGSIGLVLAVPITTLISTWMLVKETPTKDAFLLAMEEKAVDEKTHHH